MNKFILLIILAFTNNCLAVSGKSYFFDIPSNIIINVKDRKKIRYMQIYVTIEVKKQGLIPLLSAYNPLLRNEIILLLSDLKFKQASNKKLVNSYQDTLKTHFNKLLAEYNPEIEIEKVLFSSIVMQ
jgi:flagellar basal body-associated protein FliL